MQSITVNTNRPYEVIIGHNTLQNIGSLIAEKHPICKSVIISDSNVWPIYGTMAESSMAAQGFEPLHFVIPAGENSKNANMYLQVLQFLAQNEVTRTDLIIALGGGVTGDLVGFVAATYMRGISYVQVPTSLLAMVDSSVGGKTAIDLPEGKNLVGAFYQPLLVICDIALLQTLPDEYFIDGCAEIIKTAILFDELLFFHLIEKNINFDREYVITQCIHLKTQIVAADEYDKGKRQLLNLGHTFGHSLEKLSDFRISHGNAVAIGIYQIIAISQLLHFCDEKTHDQIATILQNFGFCNTHIYSTEQILNAALMDKKRTGDFIQLIIPKQIGNCSIEPISIQQLHNLMQTGGPLWTSP